MDERLKKDAGAQAARGGRGDADSNRTEKDGTSTTMDERRRMLRDGWGQTVLPQAPEIPGFHTCWLSTTSNVDPVYKRLQMGYMLVKQNEIAGIGNQRITSGEFEGCVSINEMVLAKIPDELYQEIMLINHYERPLEEEGMLKANAVIDEKDSDGRQLGKVEGFDNLGRPAHKLPHFA
jgi:hypothetical protein